MSPCFSLAKLKIKSQKEGLTMKRLTEKFIQLKTAIGGNREKMGFEDTFGMPKEEQAHITPPSRSNTRIISELEFALRLSEEQQGRYNECVEQALDYLLECLKAESALTDSACNKAEQLLLPLEKAAKEYSLILVAHAHIDMNWMWSFNETVAVVLATFRSILNIMDQYPDFHFSQSQAAVYKIVEEYDPELMERIKERIDQGRWEVTASSWVENDKNLPGTEAMLRHIQCTREYLKDVWGVQDFDIDFSPDTFGHSANIPEIDNFGGVHYFYHCRGLGEEHVLYRYKGLSGCELLAYREPNWYNGAITPHMAAGLIGISKRCAGLKTGLVVYGVGDHGGGPTRRDVERALDMMTWRIYPSIRFGTLREFFHEAESVREQLPVVDHELNCFSPGCYTTQSRLKRGNKRTEAALCDAEAMSVMAGQYADFPFAKKQMAKAWQDVLFTHFHDILTGSCVQDAREHAMGLYQTSTAVATTQIQNAMRVIAEKIDTSSISVDIEPYNTQSEGAGAGYGVENFVGVPSTERGSGKTRIFHVFNALPRERNEMIELTVWDWTGDLRDIVMKDWKGMDLESQLLDKELCQYWDHKYFRILVNVTVPAFGYTTVVLSQGVPNEYRVYYQQKERISSFYDDYVLQNDYLEAIFSAKTGNLCSLRDLETGEQLIADGQTVGLVYMETEAATSNAWQIGRTIRESAVDQCVKIEKVCDGTLRQSIHVSYQVQNSKIEAIYTLDCHAHALRTDFKIDWHEIGKNTVPVLTYKAPLSYQATEYLYDVPAGALRRGVLNNDVPGLRYGLALNQNGKSLLIASDCKYGYRGETGTLSLTLINSSTSPDPYPERGIHSITIWTGSLKADEKQASDLVDEWNHALFYQPSNAHHGVLPMEESLFAAETENIVLCAVSPEKKNVLNMLLYETTGKTGEITIQFKTKVQSAKASTLFEQESETKISLQEDAVHCKLKPYQLAQIQVKL